MTPDAIRDFLQRTVIASPGQDAAMARDSLAINPLRFSRLLALLERRVPAPRRENLAVLELGAMPFHLSALLLHRWRCRMTLNTFPARPDTPSSGSVTFGFPENGTEIATTTAPLFLFDVEKASYPFPDQSFDLLLAMDLVEHFLYSLEHFFSESWRLLRPGGNLLVTTPNAARFAHLWSLLLGRSIFWPLHPCHHRHRHNREYTAAELRAEGTSQGRFHAATDHVTCFPVPFAPRRLLSPGFWAERVCTALFPGRRDSLAVFFSRPRNSRNREGASRKTMSTGVYLEGISRWSGALPRRKRGGPN